MCQAISGSLNARATALGHVDIFMFASPSILIWGMDSFASSVVVTLTSCCGPLLVFLQGASVPEVCVGFACSFIVVCEGNL